jgi:diacylglycerol kinase family enzyme
MRTFALLYNLSCGSDGPALRRLNRLRRAFHACGVELRPYCTSSPMSTSAVVQAAKASGYEAILTAGGDGTFNDVLQAMMQAGVELPIGIVPFGSGNVLAKELDLGGDAPRVAERLVAAIPTRVPVGLLLSRGANGIPVERYFNVAAGIGADARVICGVNPAWKRRLGIGAYYIEATRQLLFSAQPLPLFRVQYIDLQTTERRQEIVSQLIAGRVGYFSSPLIRKNGVHPLMSDCFRLVLFKTRERATYLRYGLHLLARRFHVPPAHLPGVELVHARSVSCLPLPEHSGVLSEVDGEPVGGLPARIRFVPDALKMLLPRTHQVSH